MTSAPSTARPGRRTLVKGAAWATPAIAFATPAHAQVSSPGSCGTSATSVVSVSRCENQVGGSSNYRQTYTACFENRCPPGSASVTVTNVTVSWSGGSSTISEPLTLAPGVTSCLTGAQTTPSRLPTALTLAHSSNGQPFTLAGRTVGPCPDGAADSAPPEDSLTADQCPDPAADPALTAQETYATQTLHSGLLAGMQYLEVSAHLDGGPSEPMSARSSRPRRLPLRHNGFLLDLSVHVKEDVPRRFAPNPQGDHPVNVPTSKPRPGRRTLVKGAAWSVPAIAVATAVPASAQSPAPPSRDQHRGSRHCLQVLQREGLPRGGDVPNNGTVPAQLTNVVVTGTNASGASISVTGCSGTAVASSRAKASPSSSTPPCRLRASAPSESFIAYDWSDGTDGALSPAHS